jgi:hypothetical protein
VKKPFLLFTLKCTVILYFAACTGINNYTNSVAATPQVTKGTWKVDLFSRTGIDETSQLHGYDLTFSSSGKMTVKKNGEITTGNWSEDEIENKININLDTKDPVLEKLNNYWDISVVKDKNIQLKNAENASGGRLQITSL